MVRKLTAGFEAGMIALLLMACLVLAALQYRWTGELSRAEADRLAARAAGRLQQFTRAFDAELRRSVLAYKPDAAEVQRLGPVVAAEQKFMAANRLRERPLFVRAAVAARASQGALRFFQFDPARGKLAAASWPDAPEWKTLRRRLEEAAGGGGARGGFVEPGSLLIEAPVFGDEGELEWILLEMNADYVTGKWLPELAATYIGSAAEDQFILRITGAQRSSRPVLGAAAGPGETVTARAGLFPLLFLDGGGPAEPGRWVATISRRPDQIPAEVQSARRRNLGLAFLLLALIAAAGGALLVNTRRSRRLAAAQYQFFAGISHELRTPLTIIQGAAHNLLSGVVTGPEQRDTYARAIVRQSGQLTEMVEQVLAYGAARRSVRNPATAATLDVAVSEAIETAAPELERDRRSVDVDMPADLPAVRGESAVLRRVLGNLILNAVRHGGGQITVTASRDREHVEVRVADSGPGIPEEELAQVFDPFFRGSQARTGRTRGTGLGLSLVKESVEGLGGSVRVESRKGEGAAFTLRLPIAP